jgi:sulfur-oxidizing protein SoxY
MDFWPMTGVLLTRRRTLVGMGVGLLTIAATPLPAFAGDADTAQAIRLQFGDREAQVGKVMLTLPSLAETGNLVPVSVSVESPMSQLERVSRVCIFANKNPRPLVATMLFGPKAGRAAFSTNMRLSGTQDVIVIAEMTDKSLWKAETRVTVTVGACDMLQSRY